MRPISRRTFGAVSAATAGTLVAGRVAAAPRPRAVVTGAGQPYAANWHPLDFLAWTPGADPDAAYNRSTTPLARRIVDPQTIANPDARARRVMNLSVFANTDGNPSQGSAEFDYYTAEFWQYVDTLVFWGGSASEGIILAPNPTVTDAAHRNGVPVCGTIFFPPVVYGGEIDWVRQLTAPAADGSYPGAAKLAEVATYFGFDGWFINQETDGADTALATQVLHFVTALKATGTTVIWYDAMTESGSVGWQGALDSENDAFFATADEMFVDFRWGLSDIPASASYARGMGRDPGDLFFAVDTGYRQFGVQPDFDALFPAIGATGVSVGLYRPDFSLTSTDDKSAYAARDRRFWVGADGDPATTTTDADGWKGVSSEVGEHTVITTLPFTTTFCTGRGHRWADNGQVLNTGDWNNLSAQDILPTWRFIVDGAELAVDYDFAQPFHGGSSLAISGTLDGATTIPLYAARARIPLGARLEIVTRSASGPVRLSAVLRFADDPETDAVVPLGAAGGDWTLLVAGLTAYRSRTLSRVGLRMDATGGAVDILVGRLAVLVPGTRLPAAPTGVAVRRDASGAGARIAWDGTNGVRYDVKAVAVGRRAWLGATTAHAYYAWAVPAWATTIQVVPIAADGRPGPAGSVSLG
ncbi:MAG: endo-beta-N-acetylglucosaminidase [Mycobacteriales bacterium]